MSILKDDLKYVWHPFTSLRSAQLPIPIVKAKNAILVDANGNEIIDAISSWWTNIHGHCNQYINKKIAEQIKTLDHVIFADVTHPQAVTLSKRLIEITNHQYRKVFFSDNGSTAVEVAIKMAIQYFANKGVTKRTKIIALENAYHGDTFGAMSAGARSTFTKAFDNFLFEVIHIPLPTMYNISEIENQLQSHFSETVCFIYEPLLQGAAGMQMYDSKALDTFLHICKANEIVTIADEVLTGFYRTGKLFAQDYLKHKSDIVCLSKGITGGYFPLGVTLANDRIVKAFEENDLEKTFFHGHSYTGNPIICSAANASLDLLLNENKTKKNINRIARQHQLFIEKKLKKIRTIQHVRQLGTVLAFDVKVNDSGYFSNLSQQIKSHFYNKNILLRPLGNTIYILPPYCITTQQLKVIYNEIEYFLSEIENESQAN